MIEANEIFIPIDAGMNQEAIQNVARRLPNSIMHSLSQVANHTPHYPQTPGAASNATGYGMHGTPYAINTPYTPSGQTPYITPYQTPANPTPRYGEQTPSSHQVQSGHQFAGVNEADWRRAAEAWARHTSRPG